MPSADPFGVNPDGSKKHLEEVADWRWNIIPQTLPRLIPASLLSLLFSFCHPPLPKAGISRRLLWCLAICLLAATFVVDFLLWGQGHISNNWRLNCLPLQEALQAWGKLLKEWLDAPSILPKVIMLGFELPHVLGFSLLLLLGESSEVQTSTLPSWSLVFSRLSLGVNITNIFFLHYLTA